MHAAATIPSNARRPKRSGRPVQAGLLRPECEGSGAQVVENLLDLEGGLGGCGAQAQGASHQILG